MAFLVAALVAGCAAFSEGTAATPIPDGAPGPTPEAGPEADVDARSADARVGAEGGVETGVDAGRPSPTRIVPHILFRFDTGASCDPLDPNAPWCTKNEGTFGGAGVLSGATAERLAAPGGVYGPRVNGGSIAFGSASSMNAVDIPDATALVPMGTSITTFTVAAWVRRASTTPERELARIVSLAPEGAGTALFELGYNKDSETKLVLSIGDPLGSGKETSTRGNLPEGEWTFVAVTYDPSVREEACFFTGSEDAEVSLAECVDYNARSFAHADSRFSVGNAAKADVRAGVKSAAFPGRVDNVFVYLGAALDLTELAKVQRDGS